MCTVSGGLFNSAGLISQLFVQTDSRSYKGVEWPQCERSMLAEDCGDGRSRRLRLLSIAWLFLTLWVAFRVVVAGAMQDFQGQFGDRSLWKVAVRRYLYVTR